MIAAGLFGFWICLFLVVYTYLLYPGLLFLAYSISQIRRDWRHLTGRRDRRTLPLAPENLPRVSVIIPAHNEAANLPRTLANLRKLNYPKEQLEIVIVSDGSTDSTAEILASAADLSINTLFLDQRRGKSYALNQAVKQSGNDILIFSDASTLFAPDAIRMLVRHFADEKVGVVCGALEFDRTEESKRTEGIYWRYESMLRLMEARLGATLTASGAIYAMRRACYHPLNPDTLLDDFVAPMNARKLGYQVLYDPEAKAIDFAAAGIGGEFTRRVRLAMGSFRALPGLIRTPMPGFTLLAFLSHKFLRWILPFVLIVLLLSNLLLVSKTPYLIALAGQLFLYFWSSLAVIFNRRLSRLPFVLVGFFMLAMNVAFLVGFWRCFRNRQEGTWQQTN
ncbi:MAG TPA: glycosyltransferase family 2 protein [Bryobacteraceae bacterium]|nr:glycosyltransferase family 2 protein [Bryobacteraceae bacterium]